MLFRENGDLAVLIRDPSVMKIITNAAKEIKISSFQAFDKIVQKEAKLREEYMIYQVIMAPL